MKYDLCFCLVYKIRISYDRMSAVFDMRQINNQKQKCYAF